MKPIYKRIVVGLGILVLIVVVALIMGPKGSQPPTPRPATPKTSPTVAPPVVNNATTTTQAATGTTSGNQASPPATVPPRSLPTDTVPSQNTPQIVAANFAILSESYNYDKPVNLYAETLAGIATPTVIQQVISGWSGVGPGSPYYDREHLLATAQNTSVVGKGNTVTAAVLIEQYRSSVVTGNNKLDIVNKYTISKINGHWMVTSMKNTAIYTPPAGQNTK